MLNKENWFIIATWLILCFVCVSCTHLLNSDIVTTSINTNAIITQVQNTIPSTTESSIVSTTINDSVLLETTSISKTENKYEEYRQDMINRFHIADDYEFNLACKTLFYFSEALLQNDRDIINYICYGVPEASEWIEKIKVNSCDVVSVNEVRTDEGYIYNYEFTLLIDIIESSDDRFQTGKYEWLFATSEGLRARYFIPKELEQNIDEFSDGYRMWKLSKETEIVTLAYGLSYSFNITSGTAPLNLNDYSKQQICEYIRYMTIIGINDIYDLVTFDEANAFFEKTINTSLSDYASIDEIIYSGIHFDELDSLWYSYWYFKVDTVTEEHIDLTYYADISFITPAKTVRYYYKYKSDLPCIYEIETIKDYGYEFVKITDDELLSMNTGGSIQVYEKLFS